MLLTCTPRSAPGIHSSSSALLNIGLNTKHQSHNYIYHTCTFKDHWHRRPLKSISLAGSSVWPLRSASSTDSLWQARAKDWMRLRDLNSRRFQWSSGRAMSQSCSFFSTKHIKKAGRSTVFNVSVPQWHFVGVKKSSPIKHCTPFLVVMNNESGNAQAYCLDGCTYDHTHHKQRTWAGSSAGVDVAACYKHVS